MWSRPRSSARRIWVFNATLIKDATSGFTDNNYSAMRDILPLYAKLITSAEFMLEAPYGGTARSERALEARDSYSGRIVNYNFC